MAGRPEKVLEPDGSARTDLAIRMRRAKGDVTFAEIAARTSYTGGYVQQVFSGTTAPSRPAIEACLRALQQDDLSAWEPYIAAALNGGAAVPDPATDSAMSINTVGTGGNSSPPHPAGPSPGPTDPTASDEPSEPAPVLVVDRAMSDSRSEVDPRAQAAVDPADPPATATVADRTDSESTHAGTSRRMLAITVGVLCLLVAGIVVGALLNRPDSTTSTSGVAGTASSASASVQGTSVATPTDTPILVTFDALGTSATQYIQVYAGPGETSEDRQVTGTYRSGMTAPVICQAQGRTIKSDTAAGEPDRAFDVWLRIDAPGPPQFAALTYASLEPAELEKVPTC